MKTPEEIKKEAEEKFWKWNGEDFADNEITHLEKEQYVSGYLSGYNQAIKDNSDKKYTEKDIQEVLDGFTNEAYGGYIKTNFIGLLEKKLKNG